MQLSVQPGSKDLQTAPKDQFQCFQALTSSFSACEREGARKIMRVSVLPGSKHPQLADSSWKLSFPPATDSMLCVCSDPQVMGLAP
jgi:hypothetical protein